MTSQDELRDRITDLIERGETLSREGSGHVAQAIIDEFGLTVETGHITGQGYGLPGVIGKRVVGKWERNELG